MSLCDSCQRPGRCCFGFILNGGDYARGKTAEEARQQILKNPQININGDKVSCDFEPLWVNPCGGWVWWCKNLGLDGRCTIYDRRPQLCQDYQPRQDALCWHYDETTAHLLPPAITEKGTFIDLIDPTPLGYSGTSKEEYCI